MCEKISGKLSEPAGQRVERKQAYLKATLKFPYSLGWENHTRLINGRLISYWPPFPYDMTDRHENQYQLFHALNYLPRSKGRGIAQSLLNLLHCHGSLDSYCERVRKAIIVTGSGRLAENIQTGSARLVFGRLEDKRNPGVPPGLVFKSDVLGRLDICTYPDNRYVHAPAIRPTDHLALRHYRSRLENDAECQHQLMLDPSIYGNQVDFQNFLSLYNDLDYIRVRDESDYQKVVHVLKMFFDRMPDGRLPEELVKLSSEQVVTHTLTPTDTAVFSQSNKFSVV